MSVEIVKTGSIGGRGFLIVRRYDGDAWPMCLGEQFQLFGHGIIGRGWFCGYVDADVLAEPATRKDGET